MTDNEAQAARSPQSGVVLGSTTQTAPQDHWLNPVDGNFATVTDWSLGFVPTHADNAYLDASGAGPYTVTVTVNSYVNRIHIAADATLALLGAEFEPALGSVNAGTITIGDGSILALTIPTFINSGSISVGSGGTLYGASNSNNTGNISLNGGADPAVLSAGTLAGGGMVSLDDSPNNLILDVYNINDTISGAGKITDFTNDAAGVIDGSAVNNPLIVQAPKYQQFGLQNRGLIEATSAGGLDIIDTVISNFGTIAASAGAEVRLESAGISGGTLAGAGKVEIVNPGGGQRDTYLANSGGTPLTNVGHVNVETGATLNAEAITNAGQIDVADKAALQLQASIVNSGTIALASTGDLTDPMVSSYGVTLSGAGTVSLAGPESRIRGPTAAATLTNFDNTISGIGFLGAQDLTFDNQAAGVVDAVGKGILLVNTAAQTLVNSGTLEASASGTLELASQVVDQSGGGTIAALAGGRVDLEPETVIGGLFTSSGTGIVVVNATGVIFNGEASAVTVGGTVDVLNGDALTLEGTITDTGEINLWGGSKATELIVGAAGATLTGAGELVLRNRATDIVTGASAAATLTNASHIVGGGLLGDGALTLVNAAGGVINGDTATPLTIDTGTATIINAGQISASAGSTVVVASSLDESASTSRLAVAGGTLTLEGAVSGTAGIARINGGLMDFASSYDGAVWFTGTSGTLELADSQIYGGTISGFSKSGGTKLDLGDIGFTQGATTALYSAQTGILTVTNGAQTASIHLAGSYSGSTFTTSSDGHGGTTVVDPLGSGSAAPQRFAAAMAGFAPSASGPVQAAEPWREGAVVLAAPGRAQA